MAGITRDDDLSRTIDALRADGPIDPTDDASAWRSTRVGIHAVATRLVIAGLALWAVAQALPAYSQASIFASEPDKVEWGWRATLFAWSLGLFGGTGLILVAWTANVWLLLAALTFRRANPSMATAFAGAAVVCSAIGMWILLRGGFPENPFAIITAVGVGSYLWFAGTCAVLLGTLAASTDRT